MEFLSAKLHWNCPDTLKALLLGFQMGSTPSLSALPIWRPALYSLQRLYVGKISSDPMSFSVHNRMPVPKRQELTGLSNLLSPGL
jgi:hypothetical protein